MSMHMSSVATVLWRHKHRRLQRRLALPLPLALEGRRPVRLGSLPLLLARHLACRPSTATAAAATPVAYTCVRGRAVPAAPCACACAVPVAELLVVLDDARVDGHLRRVRAGGEARTLAFVLTLWLGQESCGCRAAREEEAVVGASVIVFG